jgi:hypothetical protein
MREHRFMHLTLLLHTHPWPVQVKKECSIPGKAIWVLWRTTFEIDEKYVPIKAIGKGAYGVVCSAKYTPTGEKVGVNKHLLNHRTATALGIHAFLLPIALHCSVPSRK